MSFFVYRLLPPRPSFAFDLTADEQRIMAAHGEYWTGHAAAGTALIFGPVADPAGPWGIAVVETDDLDAARALADADPAVTTGTCTFEILPMMTAVLRGDLVSSGS